MNVTANVSPVQHRHRAPHQQLSHPRLASSLSALRKHAQQNVSNTSTVSRSHRLQVHSAATLEAPTKTGAKQQPQGTKHTVIITGASSGLGLSAARELAQSGDWHVVMACRDFSKAELAAQRAGMPKKSYTVMHCDLASLESVRQFVNNFKASGMPLDALVCNAATYLPTAKEPTFTADGFELSTAANHLGHFLLSNLMLQHLEEQKKQKKQAGPNPRIIIVGSITGNTNTVAGELVLLPSQAEFALASMEEHAVFFNMTSKRSYSVITKCCFLVKPQSEAATLNLSSSSTPSMHVLLLAAPVMLLLQQC